MDFGINGKTALITGGTHGIGLSVAETLAREGCNIIVCSRTKERINRTQEIISQYGVDYYGAIFDGTDTSSVDNVIKQILDYSRVDILINNIGGGGRWGEEDILSTDFDIWQRVYNKNTNAAIKFTCATLPEMIKNKWGRVVTIASIYGKEAGGRPWFNVAKAAEIALTKNFSLRKEFVRNGVTFNTVSPGGIFIEGTGWETAKTSTPEAYEAWVDNNPMGRLGYAEEVANIVAFLCSNKASYINGANITVDGGESVSY